MIDKVKSFIKSYTLKSRDELHLTDLLYCPYKKVMEKRQEKISNLNSAIGLENEKFIYQLLTHLFPNSNIKQNQTYKYDELYLTPDFVIEPDNIIIEVKSTNYIYILDNVLDDVYYDENNKAIVPIHYLIQIMSYITLLSDISKTNYKGYLFIISNTKIKKKLSKVLVIKPVDNKLSIEFIKQLIDNFKNDLSPRYKWECYYCQFYNNCDNPNKFKPFELKLPEHLQSINDLLSAYDEVEKNYKYYSDVKKQIEKAIAYQIDGDYENEKFKVIKTKTGIKIIRRLSNE